jgi:anion-transporting  ArsA/GET3 family ATPase
VTGKGGTGKTCVAAALARAAALQGRRVLVAETGRDEHIPRLLAPGSAPVGYEGRTLQPGLTAMRIDPYEALAEYLTLQLPVRGLVSRVLRNRGFRQLMDAAPGWRELITLGKVWQLQQLKEADGSARFDLVIVDAPATGHGLTFLDVPRVVGSAVRAGPLRRNATLVEQMIRDPEATLLLPVALAEELPARETTELVERLRADVGVAVDRVVVNAVPEAPFPAAFADLDERLARLPADPPLHGLPPPGTLARCARHLRARYELNQHYVGEIGRWTGLPTRTLPLLPQGILGPGELDVLATALLGSSEAEAA